MSLLAKRYARALFEAAEERDAIDAVGADLANIKQTFADAGLRSRLLDPQTSRVDRQAMLDRVVASGHDLSRRLIAVVLRRRREAVLPELHDAFAEMARAKRGEVQGVVETARAIEDQQLKALEKTVSELYGRTVTLGVEVLPELLGGIRVRVGNTLFDGSVATALEDLERRLMEVPVP